MITVQRILTIVVFLSAGLLHAQVDRTKGPEPAETPPLTLPVLQRSSLENGMSIVLVEHHELPVVQLRIILGIGSANDPSGKAGLANLAAQMLDEGTETRDALQVADDLEFLAARMSVQASADDTYASLLTLKEHMAGAMEIFADVLLHPVFPESEWDRVKKDHLTSLIQQQDRPGTVASKAFARLTFGDSHPYGRPGDGTQPSVEAISLQDLQDFYNAHYSANNATVVVVGNVTMDEIKPLLDRHFGAWGKGGAPTRGDYDAPSIGSTQVYLIDKPEAAQSEIRIGHVGVARDNDDYFPLVVMNTILGGQFSSRINMNLRETKGYTYGARSRFSMLKQPGSFIASSAVKSAVTDSSVYEFMKELNRIVDEDVTQKELDFAKGSLIRREPRNFETPQQIAGQVQALVVHNLPDDYFETYVENLDAVTLEDVRRVAVKYIHPTTMNIVVVGDVAVVREGLERLGYGPVTVLDPEGNSAN